jgi:hypothetical protein
MVTKRKTKKAKISRSPKATARQSKPRGKRVSRAVPAKTHSAGSSGSQTRPNKYNAAEFEKKWQERWEKDRLWHLT